MHGIVVKIETVCYVHFKCCGYTLYAFYAWRNWTDSFFSLKHLVFFYARSIRKVDIKSVASSTFSQGFQDEICLILPTMDKHRASVVPSGMDMWIVLIDAFS